MNVDVSCWWAHSAVLQTVQVKNPENLSPVFQNNKMHQYVPRVQQTRGDSNRAEEIKQTSIRTQSNTPQAQGGWGRQARAARGEAGKKGRGEEREGNASEKPADGLSQDVVLYEDVRGRDRYSPRQRSHWPLLLLLHPVAPVSRYKPIDTQSRGVGLQEGEPAEAQACLARSTPHCTLASTNESTQGLR